MTRAYTDICQGEDPWTALGNFTNAWYDYAKRIRPSLVSDPLVYPEHETAYTRRWAAFCAASVEFLCDRYSLPCPEWVHDSRYSFHNRGLEVTSFQKSPHRASKQPHSLLPGVISSVEVASSKINTNCSSGCLKQGAKASPIREKSATTPVRKK